MTQTAKSSPSSLQEWVALVQSLAKQIQGWSQSQQWKVEEGQKTIHEDMLGVYTVPELRITASGGILHLNPIALHVAGGDGRVDLEAFPTLNRVKLVRSHNQWTIMTDSNVPLRDPWNQETFVRLAADLLN